MIDRAKQVNFSDNGARDVEFGLFDGEGNGVGCVEISKVLRRGTFFSLE